VPPDSGRIQAEVLEIFRRELRNPALEMRPEMETGSVDGWDSFANVEILLACEAQWGIQFSAAEIDRIRSFGDLVRAVGAKVG
jgi:acyl carrier protein